MPKAQRSTRTLHLQLLAYPLAPLTALGILLSMASPLGAQAGTGTIRVATTGSNFSGCGSAATPCETPNFAITQAQASGDVVKVETGTYSFATACSGEPAVLCMFNDIATIEGGYSGGDWTNPNPDATPTILDGLNTNRVVKLQDGSSAPPNTASLTLQGVTITGGFWQGAATGTEAAITAFGGCIDAVNATLFFTDVVISNCHALGGGTSGGDHGGPGVGGGIALRGFADNIQTSIFDNVRFEDNLAEGGSRTDSGTVRGGFAQGGGIFVYRAVLQATNLTFVDNIAQAGDATSGSGASAGGARSDAQGAGLNVNDGGSATIAGVVATGNMSLGGDASTSGGTGGGAFGAALYSELGTLHVSDVDIRQNISLGGDAQTGGLGAGGGFMATTSTNSIDRGFFIGNLSQGGAGTATAGAAGGGAVYLTVNDGFEVRNVIVADNVSKIGASGASAGGGGGGFFLQDSDGNLNHVTLAANQLNSFMQGEAIVLLGGSNVDLSYSVVSDHAGTGNGRALYVQPGNTMTLDTGLFAANSQDSNNGEAGSGTFNGLGSMSSAADVEYASPGTPNFDYHLLPTSPAIDQAIGSSEAFDVDGESRTDPDIGADEQNEPVVVDEIFSDGFESGNTTAWSQTVG